MILTYLKRLFQTDRCCKQVFICLLAKQLQHMKTSKSQTLNKRFVLFLDNLRFTLPHSRLARNLGKAVVVS